MVASPQRVTIFGAVLIVCSVPVICTETPSFWSQNALHPLSACLCFADDTTGLHSVYTVYQGHEIMFHVSTMLPYSKENKQQVRVNTGTLGTQATNSSGKHRFGFPERG